MIEEWKSALDNGNMVGSIAIDLSRAFDSLPHGLLLAKFMYMVLISSLANKSRVISITAVTGSKYVTKEVIGYK